VLKSQYFTKNYLFLLFYTERNVDFVPTLVHARIPSVATS
jgi:hypothetical protein